MVTYTITINGSLYHYNFFLHIPIIFFIINRKKINTSYIIFEYDLYHRIYIQETDYFTSFGNLSVFNKMQETVKSIIFQIQRKWFQQSIFTRIRKNWNEILMCMITTSSSRGNSNLSILAVNKRSSNSLKNCLETKLSLAKNLF